MDASDDGARDFGDHDCTWPRMPSTGKQLDQEGFLFEKLRQLKNDRFGYLFTFSTRRNEIDALLSSEENI